MTLCPHLVAVLLLSLTGGAALAGQTVLGVDDVTCLPRMEATIPVRIKSPDGIGPLQFHLLYVPAALEIREVELAEGVRGLVQFAELEPGRMSIVVTSEDPLRTDTAVVLIRGHAKGKLLDASPLRIDRARAWLRDTDSSMEVLMETRDGSLTVGLALNQPTLLIIGATVMVVILLLGRRRRARARLRQGG